MKQCTKLAARQAFAFRASAKGRAIQVKAGARFWVTNTEASQARSGFVTIDREGRGTISNGYAFTPEQIAELFQPA